MKTGTQNHKMFAILLCVSLLMVSILACRIPGRGRTAGEEPQAGPVQADQVPIIDAVQDVSEPALPCYPGIVPGRSTRAEVIGLLGQPVHSEQDGITERLYYPTAAGGQRDIIEILQDQVSYISMGYPEAQMPRLSERQAVLGQPEQTTYSTYMRGTRTYLYPGQGLLLIADPLMDNVFIQECFQPQALNDFLSRYGADLPEEDPYIRGAVTVDEASPPADDPVEEVVTDRKIHEPLLLYPGTRVIYDADDLLFGVSGTMILAVDAPLSEVIAFYRQGYQDGYLALEPDEAEFIREFVLIKDMFEWEDDEVAAFYQELVDVGKVDYSLTMIVVMPGDEFDRSDFYITQGETVGVYSPSETLIVFMMTNLNNYLEMEEGW